MAAPLVAMQPVAQAAQTSMQTAVKVLTTDIVVLRHRFYRRLILKVPTGKLTKKGRIQYRREQRLEPLDVEFHANPVGISVLALAGAVVGFGLFGKLHFGILGAEFDVYKGPFADELEDWKKGRADAKAACEAAGGTWDGLRGVCTIPPPVTGAQGPNPITAEMKRLLGGY